MVLSWERSERKTEELLPSVSFEHYGENKIGGLLRELNSWIMQSNYPLCVFFCELG